MSRDKGKIDYTMYIRVDETSPLTYTFDVIRFGLRIDMLVKTEPENDSANLDEGNLSVLMYRIAQGGFINVLKLSDFTATVPLYRYYIEKRKLAGVWFQVSARDGRFSSSVVFLGATIDYMYPRQTTIRRHPPPIDIVPPMDAVAISAPDVKYYPGMKKPDKATPDVEWIKRNWPLMRAN
jgi:hypothetical protein